MRRVLLITFAAIGFSLAIGFAALYFSPRDPTQRVPARGELSAPKERTKTAREIWKWVVDGKSLTYPKQSVWALIGSGLKVSLPLNVVGLTLGWGAAYGLGMWAGQRLGRLTGRLVLITLYALVLIPAPLQVELLRSLLVQYGWFHVRELPPAIITLGWITFPALAVNHAVAVSRARRSPAVLLVRGLGIKRKLYRQFVGLGTSAFWQTQAALLLVSLIEGPILVEYAFDLKGTGLLALKTIESADAAVVLPLVAISAMAVNLGTLWYGTLDIDPKLA